MDKGRYFENGRLKREAIAMDIKYHKISHDDLMSLISDPRVPKEFFGDPCDKIPKQRWDRQYLDKLSLAVVSECFHRDYLLYLEQVANGVGEKKRTAGGFIPAVRDCLLRLLERAASRWRKMKSATKLIIVLMAAGLLVLLVLIAKHST